VSPVFALAVVEPGVTTALLIGGVVVTGAALVVARAVVEPHPVAVVITSPAPSRATVTLRRTTAIAA
jgi:hypothetical protein